MNPLSPGSYGLTIAQIRARLVRHGYSFDFADWFSRTWWQPGNGNFAIPAPGLLMRTRNG